MRQKKPGENQIHKTWGPLREKMPRYESPDKKGMKTLKKETRTSVPTQSTHEEIALNPDYRAVQVCLDALSKGVSSDRLLFRQINKTKACSKFALAMQQHHKVEDVVLGNQSWDDINKRLIAAAGLDVHCGNTGTPKRKKLAEAEDVVSKRREEETKPSVIPDDLTLDKVKRRTGFYNLPKLLAYAMVVCDGSLDCLFATSSKLTWVEEWLFYFEFKYGRTANGTRNRWPIYATYEEDAKFLGKQWDFYFDWRSGERIVMHDAPGIPLPCPSNAELQ
ncbi:unnamed protein product [Cylindrotheca closterium]|uniref:Uncharacterized protein n=1 Tax=Cylindrotheca closterium TaxID=2856 RepID=A0AAD2PWG4_9STRA|nr:unnamed protein product [Cylindrotheca closterium]